MASKQTTSASGSDAVDNNNIEKSLFVLSAPTIKTEIYASKLTEIIEYMINFANLVHGKDDVVILADADTLPLFEGKVPSNVLLEANIKDIWIRDFSSVIPSKQVKFKFLPSYREVEVAERYENSFEEWFEKNGLEYYAKSDIILDGGNVVDNVVGTRVVVTERILKDNPSLTKSDAKNKLKQVLGVNEVAIIPEPPDDTTGHSDGAVMWPMDDQILLVKVSEPTNTETINELKNSFPGVEIVELPNYIPNTLWHGFSSAKNCYVNSIVTDNYIYMPTFNNRHDAKMLEIIRSNTNKMVVPILAKGVCEMGGSVRCLSWHVKNANKRKILQLIKQ
jgi:agmatine/peptidylarginine deiminase